MSLAEYARRFVHQDDRWVVGAEIGKALADTGPEYSGHVEHRILYDGGDVGHVLVRYSAIKDARGHMLKLVGAIQDITERKLAELERAAAAAQLAEQEATLRSVIAESLDGITLADGAGRVIEWNPAQEQIWAWRGVRSWAGRCGRSNTSLHRWSGEQGTRSKPSSGCWQASSRRSRRHGSDG